MLLALNTFLMVVIVLLLAERLEGLHVTFRSAVYVEAQARGRVLEVRVQRGPTKLAGAFA